MAQQRTQYPLEFNGPFLGLNTAQAPHALGPGFATVAENVIIDRGGSVRPREPWIPYQQDLLPDALGLEGICVGMVHLDIARLARYVPYSQRRIRILAKMFDGTVHAIAGFGTASDQFKDETPSGTLLSTLAPTWVFAKNRLYVIDGSDRLMAWDGIDSRVMGIDVPTAGFASDDPPDDRHLEFVHSTAGAGPGIGTYRYSATFYDSRNVVESNSVNPIGIVGHGVASKIQIIVRCPLFPGNQGITHVRIYRQRLTDENTDAVAQPSQLLDEVAAAPGDSTFIWDGDVPDDEITLSDLVSGPFRPTRNGLPPKARVAAWYFARMWYADPDDGTKIWYSEVGEPEHVSSTSFLPLGGEPDDSIAGMVEMAGQLVISKKDGLWIVSGNLETRTNQSDALGQRPGIDFVESFPTVYKTKSKTGCHNTGGGNGLIICGHPPMLYYSNANGLYRFDGVDDRPVSDLIDDEWRAMLKTDVTETETDHAIHYAVDIPNQVLYIMSAQLPAAGFTNVILAYHWGLDRGDGVGLWTVFTSDSAPSGRVPSFLGLACIATALGKTSDLGAQRERIEGLSTLLVAEITEQEDPPFLTRFLVGDPVSTTRTVPPWTWRTGDLALASDNRTHLYRMKYRHEKYVGDNVPSVRAAFALDGALQFDLLSVDPDAMDASIVHSHPLRRKGRTIAFDFTRANPTDVYDAWRGLTGFSVDYELAEQR